MERRVVHGNQVWQNSTSRLRLRKANGKPASKHTFCDGYGVARSHLKIFAAALRQPFGIHSQNLIITGVRSATDTDSLRRGDTTVTTGHRNCLQKIDPIGTAFGHFIATRAIYLTKNGEAAFSVTDEGDVHSRIDQIIASVKFGYFGSCL